MDRRGAEQLPYAPHLWRAGSDASLTACRLRNIPTRFCRARVPDSTLSGDGELRQAIDSRLRMDGTSMKREPSGVVLYVEDNRVNFLLVEQLLSIWSLVELHHAEDGARALDLARVEEPDLLILDLHLPDMNGLEVLRRLRQEAAFARARVAVLTASAMPGDIAAAREAGVVEYWTKPLNVPRFMKDVQRLLEP